VRSRTNPTPILSDRTYLDANFHYKNMTRSSEDGSIINKNSNKLGVQAFKRDESKSSILSSYITPLDNDWKIGGSETSEEYHYFIGNVQRCRGNAY